MKLALFDAHRFETDIFNRENFPFGHELTYFEPRLTAETANIARGFPAICAFANDKLDARTLEILYEQGTRLIALRSAGFNHVDLKRAGELGLKVVRVPAYSPYSVAEHAVALMLTLNRKIHRAYQRVREGNFTLDGLMGFDMHGKTAGVMGTGKIGDAVCRILLGFGCRVLAFDLEPSAELQKAGVNYVSRDELFAQSSILSLHVPLSPATRHLIGDDAIARMRPGVMLINTGRGLLIDTPALIRGLKHGHVGSAGLDVYEEEENIFFKDLSAEGVKDDVLARLMTFPNVVITSHQGFFTEEAITAIARTTLQNVKDFEDHKPLVNEVRSQAK